MGERGLKRAVFLDRDGVLNRALLREGKPFAPSSLADFEVLPDAADCLAELKRLGFLLIVVTNQPEVARGTLAPGALEEMHAALGAQLPLDDILCCFHDDADGCECRKPRPGLLLEAARRYGIDLARSFLIGDRWRDIEAGAAAGCRTVWIDYGYRERPPGVEADARVQSLAEGVAWIGRETSPAGAR
jgi:D-glycero-D-manno-heptose 1,7-bisphosphate phosphatase